MTDDGTEVCLRPGGLRPGGGGANPFAAFSKGAGLGLRSKPVIAQALVTEVEQTPRKPPGQIVKYDREFLLKFMDRHIKAPMELQQLQLEIVISEDTERETQRQSLKQVVEDADDDTRDWRTRAPPAAAAAGSAGPRQQGSAAPQQAATQQQQQQSQQQQQRQPPSQESLRIHKAEEKGRVAYKVGGDLGQTERALRSVKGILNKLTPEKFERLLDQLLSVITTADILKHTISLVFENAVAQPTFCAMYADLCLSLSKELPSFPPAEGDDKPVMFRRVLLNTCQDEFEGAAAAREELSSISSADERAAAERRVKSRTLGTVRLIAELYRKEVVREAIITVCLRELLEARDSSSIPPEENVESACEMVTVTGKMLAGSENKKTRDTLDGYLARLMRLSADKNMPSRMRFLIRDVLDMSKNKWVPRRETFTAKKLEQVHAEAEAELGMVSSKIGADLPALPVQSRMAAEDFSLLPPLRGGEEGWEFVGKRSTGGSKPSFGAGGSALVGEYRPPEPLARRAPPAAAAPTPAGAASRPAAAAPAAAAAAAAPKAAGKPLAAEDVANKSKSFLREYVSVGDGKEARLCLKELREAPKAGDVPDLRGVVEAAVTEVFDAQTDKAANTMLELLVAFLKEKLLTQAEAVEGLKGLTSSLGDLALDVPKAPQLLGQLVGSAAGGGALPLSVLPQLLQGAEGAEAKRGFGEAALKAAAGGLGGEAKLAEACSAAGVKAGELFAADEFDGDLPSVQDWLKGAGLSSVPL
ncbi:eukaryotic initiation factor [Scenedesmus sp. NREL 46B-D3]|nr:eukaryotic initiation factor [Scenedesmus sp. NREL 46B-D3]